MTKSRTIGNYWLLPLMPQNGFLLNPLDAKLLKLKDGDRVKVISATNTKGVYDFKNGKRKEMIGNIRITHTIRPGVTSFELGFGHWATGSGDIWIDGEKIEGDKRRQAGVHANAAMWSDPSLRNTSCMVDPVGGSVSFYDTKVKFVKV
jgi:anaerobic selenocysteine-containing dehydrogenase